jgi:tetratricopeptide (TPR) repeat protein
MGLMTAWIEKYGVGAGRDWTLSPLERWVVAGRALWFYANKLIWPTNLTFIYPRWHVDASDPAQLAYPVAAVAIVGVLWLARHRIGSGPLVAVLLFVGTLVPALGFFDVFPMRYSFVADHFQYLASIGLIALGVGGGMHLIQTLAPAHARASHAVGAILILVLATLTWRQCHIYTDQETLWTDTIRKDPASWMGHTALGAVMGRRGDLINAEYHYREAVRLNPDFGEARVNLGGLLANQGRFVEAIPHFREDVRLEPYSLEAYLSLGKALWLNGQQEEAITWFRAAVAKWPNEARAVELRDQALEAQRPP